MDALSSELQDFLIRLGREPNCVSGKVEHYIHHLLQLLYPDDEQLLKEYYGLFGTPVRRLEDLARGRGVSTDRLTQVIENSLRKIAVSPEWQMLKQLTV